MLEIPEKIFDYAKSFYAERIDESKYMPLEITKLAGLPEETGLFDPFLTSKKDTGPVWPRDEDLRRFQDHMRDNKHSHTILVGSSGTGKSVFLRQIVQPAYPDAFILTDHYNNFLSTLINALPCDHDKNEDRTHLAQRIVGYTRDAKPQLIDEVLRDKDDYPDKELILLVKAVTEFIEECLRDRPMTLFVFDQIERFVADFRYAATKGHRHESASELFCLIRLLKALRKLPNVRTVFAMRKDTLFDSVDFLSYSLDAPNDSDRIFRYMYFTGITLQNGQAAAQIKGMFATATNESKLYAWETIAQFLSLSSRSLSNTFLIQLTGYMIEHFRDTKPVKDVIKKGEPRDLLPLFFDQLIAGFHKAHPGKVNYDVLRLIMLTTAIENRETGDPISEARIAGLAHLPKNDVAIVVGYLKKVGIVRIEGADEDDAIRYAHDMLFDHIVESDSFTVRNDLHNVIERLAERRTPVHQLTLIERFGRVWRDAKEYYVGAIAVAIFIIYGGVVSLSSWNTDIHGYSMGPACEGLHTIWSGLWGNRTYVDDCNALRWYYPSIYLMDSLWVSFIYKLDRGYFTHVLAKRPIPRFIAAMMPVLGVTLGIIMSFTPVLTLVPLTVVGIVMASLLIYIGSMQKIDSIFARTARAWGIRTFSNMTFSLLLILLHWFMVTDGPLYAQIRDTWDAGLHQHFPSFVTAKNISFWATGVFFIWFLMHIRPEQKNNVSLATRLAEFDASPRKHAPIGV